MRIMKGVERFRVLAVLKAYLNENALVGISKSVEQLSLKVMVNACSD